MLIPFKHYNPHIGHNAWVADSADVIGRVTLGEEVGIWFGCVLRGDVNSIKIGDRSNIQDLSMLHVTHMKEEDETTGHPCIVGNDVTVGHRVMLHGCTIEDACLIGMSATILDGAVIGKESIVGAGSLVTQGKKFPPRSLIIGSPAKVVRQLTDEEVEELYASAQRYIAFKDDFRL